MNTEKGTLHTGDYSLKGFEHEIAIERKSLNDWVGSITQGRERLEAEIMRAKKDLKYFAIIIETDMRQIWRAKIFSKISRKAIVNTFLYWSVKYNIPIFLVSNRSQGQYVIRELLQAWVNYGKAEYKEIKDFIYG